MTKEEKIQETWIELNIETPFGICDKTGWYHGYFCNGIYDIESKYGTEITDLINYDIDISGVGKFRPKSLNGIENNNGWIKIESESDLPKGNGTFWILDKVLGVRSGEWKQAPNEIEHKKACEFWIKRATHYQPIIKPQPPIY